jgi:hypothetical protein
MSAMSEEARRRDDIDPLSTRAREYAADGLIHLNGNFLGPPRASLAGELERVVSDQWARHQVQAWFDDGWLELPRTVGDKLGKLLGAAPGQVVVAGETTSTTLFNAMVAACRLREDRPVLLLEAGSFPTDLYIAGSVARLLGRRLVVESGEGFDAFLDERGTEVAAAVASPVDFRTGQRREIGSRDARRRLRRYPQPGTRRHRRRVPGAHARDPPVHRPRPCGDHDGLRRRRPDRHALWPRGDHFLQAQPNRDGTFTTSLFKPLEAGGRRPRFSSLASAEAINDYCATEFSDVVGLMSQVATDLTARPPGMLQVIRCAPYNHRRAVLVGDAAHTSSSRSSGKGSTAASRTPRRWPGCSRSSSSRPCTNAERPRTSSHSNTATYASRPATRSPSCLSRISRSSQTV